MTSADGPAGQPTEHDPGRSGPPAAPQAHGRSFVVGLVVGAVPLVYGTWWLLDNAGLTRPGDWVRWVVGAALLHDLVLAPVAVGVGWLLARNAPAWLRRPVQVALGVSAVIVLVAIPVVGGFGARPSNPTLLPRDYAGGLAVALAVVWGVAAATAAMGWWRRPGV